MKIVLAFLCVCALGVAEPVTRDKRQAYFGSLPYNYNYYYYTQPYYYNTHPYYYGGQYQPVPYQPQYQYHKEWVNSNQWGLDKGNLNPTYGG